MRVRLEELDCREFAIVSLKTACALAVEASPIKTYEQRPPAQEASPTSAAEENPAAPNPASHIFSPLCKFRLQLS